MHTTNTGTTSTRTASTRTANARTSNTRTSNTRTSGTRTSNTVARRTNTAPARAHAQSRPTAATYVRRRVAASVLGLGLVLATAQTAGAAIGDGGSDGVSRGQTNSSVVHYRVRSGDTLWKIAQRLAPNEDPREIVDLLVEANGGAVIHPGDIIDWAGH